MSEISKPKVGVAEVLAPNLRRILAPNASPMTYWGTNTYLIGTSDITVIDPGPQSPAHLEAILASLATNQSITKIIVTHAHLDHSPLAAALSEKTGAKIYGFGGPQAGRSAIMEKLAQNETIGGGEGVDKAFAPDIILQHGDLVDIEDGALEVLHTPGHFGNHISLAWGDICFTGDHVMGWASSLVSPPDGDLTDFMASCRLLAKRQWQRFHAGHGAPIDRPNQRLDWLISHRLSREVEILQALKTAPASAEVIASQIYTDVDPRLLPVAARNVFAHLLDLYGKSMLEAEQPIGFKSIFSLR